MIITNSAGLIEYVNPAFTRLTGFTGTDVIGKTPRILKSEQHSPEFYQRMWTTISTDKYLGILSSIERKWDIILR
ncbi:MAG: PAS domain S-box protein [Anaerolineales bacterium]|nr:PAS domain S-box protein [Anaerolineales bacterium]